MTGLRAQTAATHGFVMGHLGMAVITAGITCMYVWDAESISRLKIGETIAVDQYEFTLSEVKQGVQDNYQFERALFDVADNGRAITNLSSERRFYPVRNMYTTEAGFRLAPINTIFVSLSEGSPEEGWIIRAYHHPGVIWIWIGALMMALAGFISLFDRRLRFSMRESA